MKQLVAFFAGVALGLSLLAPRATAQDKAYALSNYDVALRIEPDGTYDVTETMELDVQSGSFRTFFREIDADDLDSLSNARASSPDVALDSVRIEPDGDDVAIRWYFPPRSTGGTFEVRYRAHGGLRAVGDENVAKWMAVGSGWDVPIRDVDVRASVPAAWSVPRDSLRVDPAEARLQPSGGGWEVFFRKDRLKAGQGYAVEVRVPARIEAAEAGDPATGSHVVAALLLFSATVVGFVVARYRRRPREVDVATPRREPALSLPEAARILSDSRSGRMHVATLVDLADRGYLTLKPVSSSSWTGSETAVEIDVGPDRSGLTAFERDYLDALSECDTLEEARSETTSLRSRQRTEVRKQLVRRGWLYDREPAQNRYAVFGLCAGLGMIGAGLVGLRYDLLMTIYLVALCGASTLGALVMMRPRFLRTDEGLRKRSEVKAYVASLREEIEGLLDEAPQEAARRLTAVLPWLLLDAKVSASWFKKVDRALQDAGRANAVPSWLQTSGAEDDVNVGALMTVLVAASPSTGSGASAGFAAGAGAAGAASGGGGGAA